MFEFNGTEYFTQSDRDIAEINHLQNELAYAKQKQEIIESNLAWANSRVESAEQQANEMATKANRAVTEAGDFAQRLGDLREMFQEILEQEDSHTAKELYETFERPFERLGVSIAREVSVEISVTWRGTIELPIGVDADDLDIDDFGISINGHSEYESDISQYFEDSSIEER